MNSGKAIESPPSFKENRGAEFERGARRRRPQMTEEEEARDDVTHPKTPVDTCFQDVWRRTLIKEHVCRRKAMEQVTYDIRAAIEDRMCGIAQPSNRK